VQNTLDGNATQLAAGSRRARDTRFAACLIQPIPASRLGLLNLDETGGRACRAGRGSITI